MTCRLLLRLAACLAAGAGAQPPTLDQLEQNLRANPHAAAAHNNLGIGLKGAGRMREAMARFETALLLDPGYGRAYNSMGSAQLALGDAGAAARAFASAISLTPTLATAYSNLGNALRQAGQAEAAVTLLGQSLALGLNAQSAAAYVNLGAALQEVGRGSDAVEYLEVATALAPTDVAALTNLGAALEAAGRLAEAEGAYERGLVLAPRNVELHINRGNVLRALGRVREAIVAYKTALELEPTSAKAALAYNNLAAALQASGEQRRAMRAYEAALELQPADPTPRQNLDKLSVSPAYRAAASKESRMLAHRAAAAMLAAAAAQTAGRSFRRLGLTTGRGGALEGMLAPMLHRTIRFLRRLETEQADGSSSAMELWQGRALDMGDAIAKYSDDDTPVTLGAFAWGGVWYHPFAAVFTLPECQAVLQQALSKGGVAVALGSSIGFEAYFAALTYGLKTVGVEVLCGLVTLSETLRKAHAVPSALAEFKCDNALTFALPRKTALVYVDDTAWDAPTIAQLAQRLGEQLPKGVVVIHNTEHGYKGSAAFTSVGTVSVGTSWNPSHTVHVHMTR